MVCSVLHHNRLHTSSSSAWMIPDQSDSLTTLARRGAQLWVPSAPCTASLTSLYLVHCHYIPLSFTLH